MNTREATSSVVLIPAYQPRQVLVDTTTQLLAVGLAVVVVDDGSGEEYQDVFSGLDERVHLVRHAINRGKGAALKTGIEYIEHIADRYVIITADADGQHAVSDVERIARAYRRHSHTLLLGSRTFEVDDIPLRSKFGNVLTRRIFSLLTHRRLNDTQTGLRAFDNDLVGFMLSVPGERFEYEMNVLLACSREGIEIVELPIKTIYENNNETSHFNPIKDSLAIYGQIIKFASSSLLAFGVDYMMFVLLLQLTSSWALATSVIFANTGARLVSASFNFTTNKKFVFCHKGTLAKSILSYALLAAVILLANTIFLTVLTSIFGIAPVLAKIITEIALFFASYFVQKNIIFAKTQKGVRQ